jgi:hypothetical protein
VTRARTAAEQARRVPALMASREVLPPAQPDRLARVGDR